MKTISAAKAIAAARKKLRILPDKQLMQTLSWATPTLAESYRAGAEEAQEEIVKRLQILCLPVDGEEQHD